jgi:hypothetical protein
VSALPSLRDRLDYPDAVLSRGDLQALGYGRRAVDAIFRACPTVHLDGYARPYVLVRDFRAHIAERTYDGRTAIRPS